MISEITLLKKIISTTGIWGTNLTNTFITANTETANNIYHIPLGKRAFTDAQNSHSYFISTFFLDYFKGVFYFPNLLTNREMVIRISAVVTFLFFTFSMYSQSAVRYEGVRESVTEPFKGFPIFPNIQEGGGKVNTYPFPTRRIFLPYTPPERQRMIKERD